ncbi:tetrapyrrole biosynthesis, uroporphyrinogen III synthase [Tothia fuscella]|uniref:Tetrapyrrole biosynthesis, uroporphyrinogen III synthase n=1 Tax=Tothia fuscella TaxID=1048955 RepID=A0A9P4P3X8_9PEZI|nr:tetrapyrrole biosynthesis, uroporphyrinogen III synthase [Tothia fuscella]
MSDPADAAPVLLLKTKSTPSDGYEEYFKTTGSYQPTFVPVLEHRFREDALQDISDLLSSNGLSSPNAEFPGGIYGGIIFTSQRAVEALSTVVTKLRAQSASGQTIINRDVPLYVVGPATARGLRALDLGCPILGEETGNGDALAKFILEHYNAIWKDAIMRKPPLLFLVGEQRRDIIPKTLQSHTLKEHLRIGVNELVVYETGEMQSFRDEFTKLWSENVKEGCASQWVVVFSPTGCKAMLESLKLLDHETGKVKSAELKNRKDNIFVATIGPTTRDYLRREFDFEPDVCAETPTPEGVGNGIAAFLANRSEIQAEKTSSQDNKKRKAGDTPTSSPKTRRGKRGKKVQKTIEETMPAEDDAKDEAKDEDSAEDEEVSEEASKNVAPNGDASKDDTAVEDISKEAAETSNGDQSEDKNPKAADDTIQDSADRKEKSPSNLIEKGIIYFFTRARVGIEDVDGVQDLQRTYFILRPLPEGAKLGEGAIPDSNTNRLIALPKKSFPKSGSDRFMAFVEKSKVTMKELKDETLTSSEYDTKTMGTRVTPAITPIGEGVYAITETNNASYLAYMLTIPSEPEEVQKDMGLREKGSFILSLKNPTRKGPSYASLPEKPDFPQEIIDDFRNLAWMPVHKSTYLDYPNAQLLLIGEGQNEFGAAVEAAEKDKKKDKETPQEVLEELEDEDQLRVEHLHGDDSVFDDLHINKKDYPSVMTTW